MGIFRRPSATVWLDPVQALPWLKSRPFLVSTAHGELLADPLRELGFRLVEAELPSDAEDVEDALLVELSRVLGFPELGAGHWGAFEDRLWDLLNDEDKTPVAVAVRGLAEVLDRDLHVVVKCVHRLLSMTEGVGLADEWSDRQLEYFFVGEWNVSRG